MLYLNSQMKFTLLAVWIVALVKCQQQPYSINPKSVDPMILGQLRSYGAFYPAFFFPGSKALVRNPYPSYGKNSLINARKLVLDDLSLSARELR